MASLPPAQAGRGAKIRRPLKLVVPLRSQIRRAATIRLAGRQFVKTAGATKRWGDSARHATPTRHSEHPQVRRSRRQNRLGSPSARAR
eukprot:scaffold8593_cov106-Isochrysis_galbana.AAC.1